MLQVHRSSLILIIHDGVFALFNPVHFAVLNTNVGFYLVRHRLKNYTIGSSFTQKSKSSLFALYYDSLIFTILSPFYRKMFKKSLNKSSLVVESYFLNHVKNRNIFYNYTGCPRTAHDILIANSLVKNQD
jgi:hypothetical protein